MPDLDRFAVTGRIATFSSFSRRASRWYSKSAPKLQVVLSQLSGSVLARGRLTGIFERP